MKNKKFLGIIASLSMLLAGCGRESTPVDPSSFEDSSITASSVEPEEEPNEDIVPITTDYDEKSVKKLASIVALLVDSDDSLPVDDPDLCTVLKVLKDSGFSQESLDKFIVLGNKIVSVAANVQVGLDIESPLEDVLDTLKEFLDTTNGNQLFHIFYYITNIIFTENIELPSLGGISSIGGFDNLSKYLSEAERTKLNAYKAYVDVAFTFFLKPSEADIQAVGDLFHAFLMEFLSTITAEDIMSFINGQDIEAIVSALKKLGTVFTNLATKKANLLKKCVPALRSWIEYVADAMIKQDHNSDNYELNVEVPLGYVVEKFDDTMAFVDDLLEKLGDDFLINLNLYVGSLLANVDEEVAGALVSYVMQFAGLIAPEGGMTPVMKAFNPVGPTEPIMPDFASLLPPAEIIDWLKTSLNSLEAATQDSINAFFTTFTGVTYTSLLDKTAEFATKDLSEEENMNEFLSYYMGIAGTFMQNVSFANKTYPVIDEMTMEDKNIIVRLNGTITDDMIKNSLAFLNYDEKGYTISYDATKIDTSTIGIHSLDISVTGNLVEMVKKAPINDYSLLNKAPEATAPSTYTYRMFYTVLAEAYTDFSFRAYKKGSEPNSYSFDLESGIFTDSRRDIIYLPKSETPLDLVLMLEGKIPNDDNTTYSTINVEKTFDVSKVGTYATLLEGTFSHGKYVTPLMYRVYDPSKLVLSNELNYPKVAISETQYTGFDLVAIQYAEISEFDVKIRINRVGQIVKFDKPIAPGTYNKTVTIDDVEYEYELFVYPLEDTIFSGTWCYSTSSIHVGDTIDKLGLHVSTYVNIKPSSVSDKTADNNGYSVSSNYISDLSPEYYTVEGFDSSTPGTKTLTVHVGDTSSPLSYYVYGE